ncbi:hypothetical protein [Yeosuana sp. AK3]
MKKKEVGKFFKLFVNEYIVTDILVLDNIRKNENTGLGSCAIPQAMALLSAIDLLGFLFGKDKEANATKNHFLEFFSIAKSVFETNKYNDEVLNKLVSYRHGMMHSPDFRTLTF